MGMFCFEALHGGLTRRGNDIGEATVLTETHAEETSA